MKTLIFSLLLASVASAQAPLTWTTLPPSVAPSQQFTLTLTSIGIPPAGWAAVQFNVSVTGGTVNSAAVATPVPAAKSLSCVPASGVNMFCGVIGAQLCPTAICASTNLNSNLVTTAGSIATFTITVTGVDQGTLTLLANNVQFIDSTGLIVTPAIVQPIAIPIRTTPLVTAPPSPCDLNNDGTTTGLDVTQELARVLGRDPTPPGVNMARRAGMGYRSLNFQDVQIVINSAVNGVCAATQ